MEGLSRRGPDSAGAPLPLGGGQHHPAEAGRMNGAIALCAGLITALLMDSGLWSAATIQPSRVRPALVHPEGHRSAAYLEGGVCSV
jgi:hypothetical protein